MLYGMTMSRLAVIAGILVTLVLCEAQGSAVIEHHWQQGFIWKFQFSVSLTVQRDISSGFQIRLVFDKSAAPITCWVASVTQASADGRELILTNMYTYSNPIGTQFDFNCHGVFATLSEKPSSLVAEWYPNGGASTVQPPVTTTVTSTIPATTTTTPTNTTTTPATTATTAATVTVGQITAGCYGVSTLRNQWNSGYEAVITAPVTSQVNGWTAELRFTHPTDSLNIWTAIVNAVSSDKKVYQLKNVDWNGQLSPGSVLEIPFVIYYQESAFTQVDSCLSVSFESNPESSTTTRNQTATSTSAPSTTTTAHSTSTTSTTSSASTVPPSGADYDQALHLGLLFYEAQRSGDLPADNMVSYRGDSSLNDGSDVGLDLSGGWHDAGDHVKFGFPMAGAATMLLYGMELFKDGYNSAGQLDMGKRQVKWALDYFIKCAQQSGRFYGQVGNGGIDHSWWGRPEDMTMSRPSYYVGGGKSGGADLLGETAAALAAGSKVFFSDPTYSETLRNTAISLYEMGKTLPGVYTNAISDAGSYYASSHWQDEMAHAAAWLAYTAPDTSSRDTYITEAKGYLPSGTAWALDWDDKKSIVNFLLYHMTGETQFRNNVESFLSQWRPGGSVQYTTQGLAWRAQWGPLRYSANAAFLALLAAKQGISPSANYNFAASQIHYMLGSTGKSYLVGYGSSYPQQPHHKAASCPDRNVDPVCDWNDFNFSGPNPHVLQGALVGGPDANDFHDDTRSNYISNEVSCDYNAGFVGALAGLKFFAVNPLP